MFDHIGSKIKVLATIIYVLGVILAVLLGIILMLNDVIGYGLLVIAIGFLLSYLNVIMLYAFGQLVENSDTVVQILKEIREQDGQWDSSAEPKAPTAPSKPLADSGTAGPVSSAKPKADVTVKKVRIDGPRQGQVVCPDCGKAQSAFQDTCWNCGAKFVFDGEE